MSTPARIAARGLPITLVDGREVRLRYGFKALLALEDRFGGIGKVQGAVSSDLSGPVFGPMLDLLCAGLLDEHDGTGAPLSDRERLADLLDPALFQDYITVAGKAMEEAFPTPAPATPEPGPTAAPPSPGQTGTTSPPSPLDGPTTPGGA